MAVVPSLRLQHSVKVSYDDGCYVLDGCLANQDTVMAVSTSSQVIRCYDVRTSSHLFELNNHDAPITDMVTCPMAHPTLLFSCQNNTGVMVTDLRTARPVHFLSEMVTSGLESFTLSVSEDGLTLALPTNKDIQLIDTRTWSSARTIPELHTDEITRLRFCGSNLCCSAGEDQMVNVFSTTELNEDDMMVNIINTGEVITRMQYFAPQLIPAAGCPSGAATLVGSCENVFVVPLGEGDDIPHEKKLLRPNFETYQVDFVAWHGSLAQITGLKDEDGNIGPLALSDPLSGAVLGTMRGAHQEVVRVALSLGGGKTLITGGEDGTLAYWAVPVEGEEDRVSNASSSNKQRVKTSYAAQGAHPSRPRGKPY